jgi:PKD repeat protein
MNRRIRVGTLLARSTALALLAVGLPAETARAVEYFVKPAADGGDDGNTGVDWDNALATVAVGIAKADSTIVTVRAGTYDVAAELLLTKAIMVRSELGGLAGAAATIVRRPSAAVKFRIFNISHADAIVEALTIQGGVTNFGGGVLMTAGTVRDCIVRSNKIENIAADNTQGGGIHASGGLILNTVITNNTADSLSNRTASGAGAYLSGTALMDRCLIAKNETIGSGSGRRGGGLYLAASTATARNCLILNNKVTGTLDMGVQRDGGGVYLENGLIENCTVVANEAIRCGGGVYRAAGNVRNTIMVSNAAHGDPNYSGAAAGLSYSLSEPPLIVNTGNVAEDPLFVDAGAGNYRLRYHSPGVDAGLNDVAWMNDGLDFDGNARITNAIVDMGAYEYAHGSEFAASFSTASSRIGYLELANVVFDATLTGSAAQTQNVSYVWTFGNESVSGTDLRTVTRTFSPGVYTVTLAVTNQVPEDYIAVRERYIRVGAEEIHVAAGGTALHPYSTPATAATNFPAAHDLIRDMQLIGAPVRVWVHDGDWALDGSLELSGDSIVRSVNGASLASLYRPSSVRQFRVADLSHASAVLEDLTIRDGRSIQGGGIRMSAGTVRDCIVTGNRAEDDPFAPHPTGGGIHASGGLILDTVITNNSVDSRSNRSASGAGAYLLGTAIMDRCLIAHNEGNSNGNLRYGGGLFLGASTAIARNCLIRNNRVAAGTGNRFGGGVYINNGLLESCTVVDNEAPVTGGGVYRVTSGNVRNSIIVFNTATADPNYSGAAANLSYSCTELPLVVNTGNIAADPEFVDRNAGDFRLQAASLGVDSGHPGPYTGDLAWLAAEGATDYAGAPRLSNDRIDMGAYEYQAGTEFAASFEAIGNRIGHLDLTVEFTATLLGSEAQTQDVDCFWSFGDGETRSGIALTNVTHTFGPGAWTVTLSATNALDETAQVVREDYIRVGAAEIHVAAGGTALHPYATPATAATNFPAAHALIRDMQLIGAPVRVWVHDGDWAIDGSLELSGDSVVRSVNGASLTTLYRPLAEGQFRIFLLNHANALVEDLTIRGGMAPPSDTAPGGLGGAGGGILIASAGGIVSNCIITGNSVVNGVGAPHTKGGGIYAAAGRVVNTVITNNTASATDNRNAEGAGAYLLGTALMDRCLIAHNETMISGGNARNGGGLYLAASTATARNCLIRNNKVLWTTLGGTRQGGGVYINSGLLESCTVVDNEAATTGGGVFRAGGNIRNSIVVFNTATTDANYSGLAANLSYSCTEPPLIVNVGNIAADPSFIDRDAEDYRLKTASPCVMAGHSGPYEGDLAWITAGGAVDLAGAPRLMNKRLDMGAYETYVPPTGTLILMR